MFEVYNLISRKRINAICNWNAPPPWKTIFWSALFNITLISDFSMLFLQSLYGLQWWSSFLFIKPYRADYRNFTHSPFKRMFSVCWIFKRLWVLFVMNVCLYGGIFQIVAAVGWLTSYPPPSPPLLKSRLFLKPHFKMCWSSTAKFS